MYTERHELEAYLGNGEFYTPEQTEQIIDTYYAWERDLGGDATEEQARDILAAIVQHVDGELDLDKLAAADQAAAADAADARRKLRAATVVLVRAGDVSERAAMFRIRVTRPAIRAWLGK